MTPDFPVLFLDVDGVLNRCGKSGARLEAPQLDNLVRIVKQTNCKIVLSSSWRNDNDSLREITTALEDLGLRIYGRTPDLAQRLESGFYVGVERGHEIQHWMDHHFSPRRFCILDDCSDMAHLRPWLVLTNSYDGLTNDKADSVIELLTL